MGSIYLEIKRVLLTSYDLYKVSHEIKRLFSTATSYYSLRERRRLTRLGTKSWEKQGTNRRDCSTWLTPLLINNLISCLWRFLQRWPCSWQESHWIKHKDKINVFFLKKKTTRGKYDNQMTHLANPQSLPITFKPIKKEEKPQNYSINMLSKTIPLIFQNMLFSKTKYILMYI